MEDTHIPENGTSNTYTLNENCIFIFVHTLYPHIAYFTNTAITSH